MRNKFLLLFFICLHTAFSQNDSTIAPRVRQPKLCEVRMRDGSSFQGFVEKQNDTLIYLKSSSGIYMLIPKKLVSEIDFVKGHAITDSLGNVVIHLPPIADNYYVVTSNAFLFKKGEVYGSSSYFLFWNVNYAFNKNFSGGISSSIIGAPIGLHLKGNFEIEHKLYLGIEGLAGTLSYLGSNSYGDAGTVKITYGDEKKNYTLFAGYIDAEYYVMPRRRGRRGGGIPPQPPYYERFTSPEIGAAISIPLSKEINFTSEAFAFPGVSIYILSLGLRSNISKNISWMFALQAIGNANVKINRVYPIPYLGFSFRL